VRLGACGHHVRGYPRMGDSPWNPLMHAYRRARHAANRAQSARSLPLCKHARKCGTGSRVPGQLSTRRQLPSRAVATVRHGQCSRHLALTLRPSFAMNTGTSSTIKNSGSGRKPARTNQRKTYCQMNRSIRWVFPCGHTIVCTCSHFIGQPAYCTKCNKYEKLARWENYEPNGATANPA
jgi:hypothetical protein